MYKNLCSINHVAVALALVMLCAFSARADDATIHDAAQIGITAESLVLADADAHANAILTRVHQATSLRTEFEQAQANAGSAAQLVTSLAQQLFADPCDVDLQLAYANAVADLAEKRTVVQTARNALFQEATTGLAPEEITALQNWQESASKRVPAEFRVLIRTEQDWRTVEIAIRAERRAQRRGESLAAEHASLLTNIRADPGVTAAAQRLVLRLADCQQIFSNAVDW